MSENFLVSVVVPAYNCEKTISKNIEALLGQTHQPIEIIVVDDGSVDKTAEIVKSFSKVKYVYQTNAGPASARNHGAFEAKGDFVFFTDSDCVPNPDWIETSLKYFSDPKIGAVMGSYDIANPESILARCIHREILYRHRMMPQFPKVFGSYNVAIRRKIFADLKGFDVSYRNASGEDNDLSYKILKSGHKIYFAKDSLVKHFHTTKVLKYLSEQFRHGFWRIKMYADHPQMAKGDDYTFWKDMVEVPLAVGVVGAVLFWWGILPCLLEGLSILEVVYGFLMMKSPLEAVFYGFVMFLRAFWRTAGFTVGIFKFAPKIFMKISK